MICPGCGHDGGDARFCSQCGLALAERGDSAHGGELRQLTVLFCDLVESTALAARVDIEDWRQVLRTYEEAVAQVIVRHGGQVAQYQGDGVVAYFGYPRAQVFPFNFDTFFHKCCRAQTIVGASVEPNQASTRTALDLIASGKIDVSQLITHRFPFDKIMEAYEMHRTRCDECVKIVIETPLNSVSTPYARGRSWASNQRFMST